MNSGASEAGDTTISRGLILLENSGVCTQTGRSEARDKSYVKKNKKVKQPMHKSGSSKIDPSCELLYTKRHNCYLRSHTTVGGKGRVREGCDIGCFLRPPDDNVTTVTSLHTLCSPAGDRRAHTNRSRTVPHSVVMTVCFL